jgi:hypothetical protein
MKIKKKYFHFAFYNTTILLSILFISCSSKLLNGQYKGVELISVTSNNKFWPGVFKPYTNADTARRLWCHMVTILVKDKKAKIIKEPFYIKNDSTYFSKSDGGFYYYSGDINFKKENKTFRIFSSLDSCKFCPKLPTATPLYVYESYYIKKSRHKLIVSTNYEKSLTFKKK